MQHNYVAREKLIWKPHAFRCSSITTIKCLGVGTIIYQCIRKLFLELLVHTTPVILAPLLCLLTKCHSQHTTTWMSHIGETFRQHSLTWISHICEIVMQVGTNYIDHQISSKRKATVNEICICCKMIYSLSNHTVPNKEGQWQQKTRVQGCFGICLHGPCICIHA